MPKREDESYRQIFHNGHPPGCTCPECNELAHPRQPRLGEQRFIPWEEEKLPRKPKTQWVPIAVAILLLAGLAAVFVFLGDRH